MGEAPVTIIPSGRSFADKSVEELEKILDALTPGGSSLEGESQATEPVPVEEAPAPTPPEESDPTPPEPPPVESEVDVAAHEREGDRISREKLEAQLSLLMAHNSRLAGKLGFLEQKLSQPQQASEPYEPQTPQEVDRLTLLEQRLAQSEERVSRAQVSQAVAEAVGSLEGPWVQELAAEIASVAPKYADQIKAAQETSDPELARQIATAVATVVKAEATQMAWQKRHETMVAQKTAATADMAKAKKAQTPSGSGGVPSPAPKSKTFGDMTASELDDWLKRNVS